MLLGRVIGTLWATRKDPKLDGLKLQIVQRLDLDLEPASGFVVAVDACEAGVGEVVLIAQGSSGRQTELTHNKPVDAVIMAIVDNLELLDEAVLAASYKQRDKAVQAKLAEQRL